MKTPVRRPSGGRNSRFRKPAAAVLAALILAWAAAATAAGQVGESAADFTLMDSEGGHHTLGDYRGQVVLLFMVGYA